MNLETMNQNLKGLGDFNSEPNKPFSCSIFNAVKTKDHGLYGKFRPGSNCWEFTSKFLASAGIKKEDLFVDPMEGSGSSRYAAQMYGCDYQGYDLEKGFDILTMSLADTVAKDSGKIPKIIFADLPYGGMVQFSGNVFGSAHANDLSRAKDDADFMAKVEFAINNMYDALQKGGHLGLMMGNYRKDGVYHPYFEWLVARMPGKIKNVIVKLQPNAGSSFKKYASNFIANSHIGFVWAEKDQLLVAFQFDKIEQLKKQHTATWKNMVRNVILQYTKPIPLLEVYQRIEKIAQDRLEKNQNWQAKVRQTLQFLINDGLLVRTQRGEYKAA